MKKQSPDLSDAQRLAYLEEHFSYEVREMVYCCWFSVSARQHKVGVQKDLEQFLENTALDHFLLHARNLLEFYYEVEKPHMYAHASAFVKGWRPPRRTPQINMLRNRVYPEVTHLGWSRLATPPSDKSWILADVAKDLLLTTIQFLDSLDQKYKSDFVTVLRVECDNALTTLGQNRAEADADLFKSLEAAGHLW
jgi:hypothetical protein